MKPFQPRCSSAQIERKWPATKDYFSFGEEAIAFPAGPRARCAWHQVACRVKAGHVSRISPSYQPPASVNSIAGSTASIFARSSALMRSILRTLILCMDAFPNHSRGTSESCCIVALGGPVLLCRTTTWRCGRLHRLPPGGLRETSWHSKLETREKAAPQADKTEAQRCTERRAIRECSPVKRAASAHRR